MQQAPKVTLDLRIHNWRCFQDTQYSVPLTAGLIVDSNGSGKTSLMSALYSVVTGWSWPGTKFIQHLTTGSQYLGVSTQKPDWNLLGKLSTSARLIVKHSLPESWPEELIGSDFPKVFTYLPTDNYWLTQSRTARLQVLDSLLEQVYGNVYRSLLEKLSKSIRSKQKLIQHSAENQIPGDPILIQHLGSEICQLSLQLWSMRQDFWNYVALNLLNFQTWINSPIAKFELHLSQTDLSGNRKDRQVWAFDNDLANNYNWQILWTRELAAGQVLFGAHRDDFNFQINHTPVEEFFSRGEMRLFVVFIKFLAISFGRSLDSSIQKTIWFLLDDVFNELDTVREQVLFEQLLSKVDYFLATSTRASKLDIPVWRLSDLQN